MTELRVPALLFGVELEIDALTRMFGLFTVPVWLLAGVAIRGSVDDRHARRRLLRFYVLAMLGNLGMLVAADLVSLYLSFALLSFASYGLVAHDRTVRAQRAGRVYIAFTVFGELLLFAGLILAAASSDTLSLASVRSGIAGSTQPTLIAALLLGGFGVKAGVLLLHMWMPLAYAAAPIPAATVLAGVLVKTGLLGWLRTLPLGLIALHSLGAVVMGAGITAAFYGVVVGLTQRDAKPILAYSSVSQMGLVTLAIGVALTEPSSASVAVTAATVFAIHHGLSKAGLFLGVGVAHRRLGPRARVAVATGLVLLSLSLAGLPLSTGAIAKHSLKLATHHAPAPWTEALAVLLSLSSAATLILVLHLLARLRSEAGRDRQAPGAALTIPWALTTALALVSLWFVAWPHAREALALDVLWSSTWPILLGLGVYLGARRSSLRLPTIPPGDLLVVLERALEVVRTAGRRIAAFTHEHDPRAMLDRVTAAARALARRFVEQDTRMGWTLGAMVLLAVMVLLGILSRC